jgi:hypothetical protein
MKTPGRVLIIVLAFALVMGITYLAVNAQTSTTSTNVSRFEGNAGLPRSEGGERNEFHAGGWIVGALKNVGIVSIIVALVVLPKGWMQKRKRTSQLVAG